MMLLKVDELINTRVMCNFCLRLNCDYTIYNRIFLLLSVKQKQLDSAQ